MNVYLNFVIFYVFIYLYLQKKEDEKITKEILRKGKHAVEV